MQENIYFEGYYTGLRELLGNGAIRGIRFEQKTFASNIIIIYKETSP